jgi:hypothetical protein
MKDNYSIGNITEKLKRFFNSRNDIYLAFLMGSQASGRAKPDSDVDVAVLFVHSPAAEGVLSLKEELECLVKKDIDLVILNEAGPVICKQALKTGILLLSRNCSYENFFTKTINDYDDLKYYRRDVEKNILEGKIYA